MESRISKLEVQVGILKESVELKNENLGEKIDYMVKRFDEHDKKEMEKYDTINKSINAQNYKIGALILIVTGAVNIDKLAPYLSAFGF
jgi:hypothetical protein